LANVDSVEYSAEKNIGNEAPEKETSVKTKAGPWQEDGDHSGSILNGEGRPEKVLDSNGESRAKKMTTGLHLDTLSMQFQKEIGPSTKLGPIQNIEGCNKNNYPIKAQLAKRSPDMFSKVYVRQRNASSKAVSLEPVAEEPNLLKEGTDQQHLSGLNDSGPKHNVSEECQLLIFF